MKLTIKREELLKGLHRVQGVVERRSTMPILSNVLLTAASGGITLAATDLEIAVRGTSPAQVMEEGGVTLSARKTFEIVKELTEEEVRLEGDPGHRVTLRCGAAQFRILGLPPEEFPRLPEQESEAALTLPAATVGEMIRKTIFSTGENDTRYVLNGVLLKVGGGKKGREIEVEAVGTDGHRLALVTKKIALGAEGSGRPEDLQVIIPKKAVLELRRILEEDDQEVAISASKNHIFFRQGGNLLLSRLIDGTYPNYLQVVPKDPGQEVTLNREALLGALRRVSVLARDKTNAIRLRFTPGRLLLTAENPDLGEAEEEILADYQGEEMAVGFNARYLLDVLGAMDREVITLGLHDPLSPCLIRQAEDREYLCVIMPMRV
ncbi:MAG: DNA polymerase III subunit beta [Nitrospirae bacterium]|nr:DNA polymerase III subunit beta [Nitrospirota bacterium]